MGIITSFGEGVEETFNALKKNICAITPITLFKVLKDNRLPVGEISNISLSNSVPRIHQLALKAAEQAMCNATKPPDAVIIGITTGGMFETEKYIKQEKDSRKEILNQKSQKSQIDNYSLNSELFHFHSPRIVGQEIAKRFKCKGPVIIISTACSSGTVAISTAMKMIKNQMADRVLAGGVDSLCRLTYYGFNSLQLIDKFQSRPFDRNRNGMSVGEGAAMLLLTSENSKKNSVKCYPEILGGGLSCDAFHVTTPHPNGEGAVTSMKKALIDADVLVSDIDYINLHGTGTIDNDSSEAKAVNTLFKDKKPFLSSIKGAIGHTLAASGAIETVISVISIHKNIIPANTGFTLLDDKLNISPVSKPIFDNLNDKLSIVIKNKKPYNLASDKNLNIKTVLSNSFGFGGNNASIVIGLPQKNNIVKTQKYKQQQKRQLFKILGASLITGAGNTEKTIKKILERVQIKGIASISDISDGLPKKIIRRLKRLPRMALFLASYAHKNSETNKAPSSIFMGTGWGTLSETNDFLDSLFDTDEKFPSPTDFVGSVHNAPAGQIAMLFKSKGANITTTGGNYSFEQAFMTAQLFTKEDQNPFFLLGADESHKKFSQLFDRSISSLTTPADGGGAFFLKPMKKESGYFLDLLFYENIHNNKDILFSLIDTLGGYSKINSEYGSIFVGIPDEHEKEGQNQLKTFLSKTKFLSPVIDYRKFTGQFASATSTATVLAFELLQIGNIPAYLNNSNHRLSAGTKSGFSIGDKNCLILGLGSFITAIKIGLK